MKLTNSYVAIASLSFSIVFVTLSPRIVTAIELHEGLVAYWPLDSGTGAVATDKPAALSGVELTSASGFLAPAEQAAPPFSFLLSNAPEQITFGSLWLVKIEEQTGRRQRKRRWDSTSGPTT